MSEQVVQGTAVGGRRPSRGPGLQAAAESRTRLFLELRGCVHLSLADGGDLLAVPARRRHGRAGVRLAHLHPVDRDAFRRARVRRTRESLPGRRRPLPVQQVLGRAGLRVVRRLVLRNRAAGHGCFGRHRRRPLHHRARPQLVRHELGSDEPHDDPSDHARPARDPDRRSTSREQGSWAESRSSASASRSSEPSVSRSSSRSTASITGLASCSRRRGDARRDQRATASDFDGSWLPPRSSRCSRRSTSSTASSPPATSPRRRRMPAGRSRRSMRWALIWGGIASLILTAALLLAMPKDDPIKATVRRRRRPVHPRPALEWDAGLPAAPDHLRVLLLRNLRPGRGQPARVLVRAGRRASGLGLDLQGQHALPDAGQRVAHRRGRSPCCSCSSSTPRRSKTSTSGSSRTRRTSTRSCSLVSFGVSGIYLSFLLTVIACDHRPRRGWVPEGSFRLGRGAGRCRSSRRSTSG